LNPRHSVPQTDALPAELLPPQKASLAWAWDGKKQRQEPDENPRTEAEPQDAGLKARRYMTTQDP
jgi:hypothetical protein